MNVKRNKLEDLRQGETAAVGGVESIRQTIDGSGHRMSLPDLDALFRLFEELRSAGYQIDAWNLAAAQKLVLDLIAEDQNAQPERLRTLLAPVFAKTPEQQADFYRRFMAWLTRTGRRAVPDHSSPASSRLVQPGQTEAIMRRGRRWPVVATTVGFVVALSLLLVDWSALREGMPEAGVSGETVYPPEMVPTPERPEQPFGTAVRMVPPLLPVAIFGGWLYLRWRRRQLWLERRRGGESVDLGRLRINASLAHLFASPAFRRSAQSLRQPRYLATPHLDADRTVLATAARAGLFEPVYERRSQTPEYLFLIEQSSANDHVARQFDEAVERLKDEGVFIDRYYFFGDPRLCNHDDPVRTPIMLDELAARRHDHRLVVIGTADGFFHPTTGELEHWLEQFSEWPSRTVMSTRLHPLDQWSLDEIRLLGQGFSLGTASPRGMCALAEHSTLPVDEQEPVILDGQPPPEVQRRRLRRDQLVMRSPNITAKDVIARLRFEQLPGSFRAKVTHFLQAHLGSDLARFGGRAWTLAELDAWLADETAPQRLLLMAPAGRGKTTLLVRWISRLPSDWVVIFLPISIRFDINRPATFYQALAGCLADVLNTDLPASYSDTESFYKDLAVEYLDRLAEVDARVLLIVDGLDEATEWISNEVLEGIPANVRAICSARPLAGDKGPDDWLHRLGWGRPRVEVQVVELPPLDRDGIADLLHKGGLRWTDSLDNVDVCAELLRLTGGEPLLLQYYIEDFYRRDGKEAQIRPEDLRNRSPGVSAYFRHWFDDQRMLWEQSKLPFDRSMIDAILAELAFADELLSLEDLNRRVRDRYGLKSDITSDTLQPIRRLVMGDGVTSGLCLAHVAFREYLRDEYFGGSKANLSLGNRQNNE